MSQERSYVVSSKWNGELTGMYIDAGKGLSFREYKNEILIGGGAHRKPVATNIFGAAAESLPMYGIPSSVIQS